MSEPIDIQVPDLGSFHDVPVIDVLVKPGDRVEKEDPLITLESDKATMDVPAPRAGVVREIRVKRGDRVSKGSLILTLEPGEEPAASAPAAEAAPAPAPAAATPSPGPVPAPAA